MEDSHRANLNGFRKLQQEYASSILEKMGELKKCSHELHRQMNIESLKNLKMKVHKIAGNAGAYGFSKASELGSEFEEFLSLKIKEYQGGINDAFWLSACDEFILNLEEAFLTDKFYGNGV